jgi:hypothetical protein
VTWGSSHEQGLDLYGKGLLFGNLAPETNEWRCKLGALATVRLSTVCTNVFREARFPGTIRLSTHSAYFLPSLASAKGKNVHIAPHAQASG